MGAVDLLPLVDEGRGDGSGRTVRQAITTIEQGRDSQVDGQGDGDNGDNQCKHGKTSFLLFLLGRLLRHLDIITLPRFVHIDSDLVFGRFRKILFLALDPQIPQHFQNP